jgi:putative DNA primase/helicase
MTAPSLHAIAKALGGTVARRSVLAPGPGHTAGDRSLSVTLSATSPDGFMVYSHAGDDWQACRDHVRARLGLSPFKPGSAARITPQWERKPVEKTPADNREAALQIWHKAVDPRGSPVEAYLKRRGLDLPNEAAFEVIRYQPRLRFLGKTFPAMIALVRGIDGDTPQAIHITSRIDPAEGQKRERYSYGPIAGGAIKLTPDADVTLCLGVGEGIESTLSLRCWDCFGASPVWSLISKNGVEAFPVLAGIETLWIAVDEDPAGIAAAGEVASRWLEAGREVFKLKANNPGADLNDATRQRRVAS